MKRSRHSNSFLALISLTLVLVIGLLAFSPLRPERLSARADQSENVSSQEPTEEPILSPEPVEEPEETTAPLDIVAPANPVYTAMLPAATPEPEADEEPIALPLAGRIIGIDPGHQAHGNSQQEPISPGSKETKAKVSSGTAGVTTRVAEYVTVLDIGLQLKEALEALGATVVMTRETHDVDISNIERAQIMNEAGAEVALRLHCNGSNNHDVKGLSLFCKATGEGAEESYALAEALLGPMLDTTGAQNRGIFVNDNYTGQNWCMVPCVMVEMGFMSNPEEDILLNDPDYQQKLVDGMVLGIIDYLSTVPPPEPAEEPAEEPSDEETTVEAEDGPEDSEEPVEPEATPAAGDTEN